MSDVIAFLELLGRSVLPMSEADRLQTAAKFGPEVESAFAARDAARLVRMLGGRAFMACSIMAPEADEPLPDEQPAAPDDVPDDGEVRAA